MEKQLATKGRNTYQFPLCMDVNQTNQTIQNFLSAYKFAQKRASDNTIYFERNDSLYGRFGFWYSVDKFNVNIYVWVGKYDKPYLVVSEAFSNSVNVSSNSYRNMLVPLFDILSGQDVSTGSVNTNQSYQNSNQYNVPVSNNFAAQVNEKK